VLKPLTKEQKANNKEKSRTRARVERIFGFVENSMNDPFVRKYWNCQTKSKNWNDSPCGINASISNRVNLTYNICRCVKLKIAVSMG